MPYEVFLYKLLSGTPNLYLYLFVWAYPKNQHHYHFLKYARLLYHHQNSTQYSMFSDINPRACWLPGFAQHLVKLGNTPKFQVWLKKKGSIQFIKIENHHARVGLVEGQRWGHTPNFIHGYQSSVSLICYVRWQNYYLRIYFNEFCNNLIPFFLGNHYFKKNKCQIHSKHIKIYQKKIVSFQNIHHS